MNTRVLVITLFFGAFVASINGFALGPFLAVIADDIDSTAPLVGQAVTAALVSGAVVGLVLGPMGDHYGLRRLLICASLLAAVSSIGTALAFNYWSLVLSRIPAGIAAALMLGLGISVVNTRVPEEDRRSAIAWLASAGALAAILGVPFLAFIAEHLSWRVGFGLVGFLGFVLTIAYLRFVSSDPAVPNEPFQIAGIFSAYRGILNNARMTLLQVGNLLWSLVWMGALAYHGAYVMLELGASVGTVGYHFMLGGICFFLGNRSAVWLAKVSSPQHVIIATGLILGTTVVYVFSISTSVAAAAIALALMSGACGTGIPIITILISEASTGAQGSVMMLRQFTWGMGAALGAASGGMLLGLGGFGALGVGLASIVFLAISSLLLSLRPMTIGEAQSAASHD
jgi:predicted MFS family arabinose efflux permease